MDFLGSEPIPTIWRFLALGDAQHLTKIKGTFKSTSNYYCRVENWPLSVMHSRAIIPSSFNFCEKNLYMLICLVLLPMLQLFAKSLAPLLSTPASMDSSTCSPILVITMYKYTTSCTMVTTVCFCLSHWYCHMFLHDTWTCNGCINQVHHSSCETLSAFWIGCIFESDWLQILN